MSNTINHEHNETNQELVIRFLSDPASHEGHNVEHIETHISHIFLAGKRVYKLKKSVVLPFLDFSTIAKRKHACHREIIINRRYAPEIYLRVDRITKTQNTLQFGGLGKTVDHVVTMTRFDDGHLLSDLCNAERVQNRWIIDFADRIAEIHRASRDQKSLDRPEHLVTTALDTLKNLTASIRKKEDRARIVGPSQNLVARFHDLSTYIDERNQLGFVRHCHADLHLENVCLVGERLLPFDAIEFSDRMANIDVAYDIAFLLMDLIAHEQPRLANLFLSRYLSATRDFGLLRLLEPCVGLRAAVRALVLSIKSQATGTHPAMMHEYLDLFSANSSKGVEPSLTAIGGRSGSGKSTVAPDYALNCRAPWGAVVLNSDVIRKRMAGIRPEQHLRPDAYSLASSEEIYESLFKDAANCLAQGHPVLLDATFLTPDSRQRAETLAKKQNVPFQGYWLEVPRDELRQRVKHRTKSVSDADIHVLNKQLDYDVGQIKWKIVESAR